MNQKYLYGTIDYTSLIKARNFLAEILQNAKNDYEKTGVVKAFEFCYELSWKIMKKVLKFRGVDVETPRDTFREAAKLNLIADAEVWFSYLEKRNITVHTYQKEILDDLFSNTAKDFLKDLDYLLKQLETEAPKYAPNEK